MAKTLFFKGLFYLTFHDHRHQQKLTESLP
ncbi:MAG: hypothetical protein ACI85E_002060 [Marinomonas primoryensis]